MEVASGRGFYQALEAGCDPRRGVFAGQGKLDTELRFCLERGIGEIMSNHSRSSSALAAYAAPGDSARIAVRVNPQEEQQAERCVWGGCLPFWH